jgi:serine/threonine protein kinase
LIPSSFDFKGKNFKVIDRAIIGRKEFLLTRQISSGERRRFLAFDRLAGPRGSLRIVQFMPRNEASWQRVNALSRLGQHNPELPQIVEFHQIGDEIISVETWIEGRDLQWWIQGMRSSGKQRLGTPEVIRLFRQLAHAIHHLHQHPCLVHGDIRPSNILLSHSSRRLALIDFGSAWGIERTVHRKQGDGKSDIYAAPELLQNLKSTNFRADYFSLAVVCFEVLTLNTPYEGLGGRAGLQKYKSESDSLYVPPSRISSEAVRLDKKIWRVIDALLERSLQLDPDQRPESGSEWLRAWDEAGRLLRDVPVYSFFDRVLFKITDWFASRKSN